jgi:putative proteasome-type protease
LHIFGLPGERLLVLQTAGNLATSQSVISLLRQRLHGREHNLYTVNNLFEAAGLVGNTLREVLTRDASSILGQGVDFGCSFVLGGQIGQEPVRLFNVYPQGNFIESTADTPYFQIGESTCGKPILDRALSYDTPLQQALRCALISFDSTIHSNLSEGMPLDLLVYRASSLEVPTGYRVCEDDPYYQSICGQWGTGLLQLISELPAPPEGYWQ